MKNRTWTNIPHSLNTSKSLQIIQFVYAFYTSKKKHKTLNVCELLFLLVLPSGSKDSMKPLAVVFINCHKNQDIFFPFILCFFSVKCFLTNKKFIEMFLDQLKTLRRYLASYRGQFDFSVFQLMV